MLTEIETSVDGNSILMMFLILRQSENLARQVYDYVCKLHNMSSFQWDQLHLCYFLSEYKTIKPVQLVSVRSGK